MGIRAECIRATRWDADRMDGIQIGYARVSTIDLVGNGFTLLTGRQGADWAAAAGKLNIKSVAVGEGDYATADPKWRETYDIEESGAVLVRPDGYVGWRSAASVGKPGEVLGGALNAIHGRA